MPINSFLYPGAKVTLGYDVDNSCRFDDGSSAYMHKTPGSAGDQQKFTFSFWIKRCGITTGTAMTIFDTEADDDNQFKIRFNDNGTLTVESKVSDHNDSLVTNQLFRDPSAWSNFVIAFDTTQGTASNRVKIYHNGTQITSFGTENYPAEDLNTLANAANKLYVGTSAQTDAYCDMYIAEFCLVDGSQLAATSFGEFDEDSPTIWKPINVSGLTFGTNGFYLDFEDSANLGNDANGGTDLTEVNLAATDQTTDTPTNSFAIANSILHGGTTATLSEGNCKLTIGTSWKHGIPTIGVSSGKWIMEQKIGSMGEYFAGVIDSYEINSWGASGSSYAGQKTLSIGYYSSGTKYIADSASSYGASYTTNDIIGTAIDLDAGTPTITFYKNGSSQGTENLPTSSNSTGLWFFMPSLYNGTLELNFGNPPYANSSSVADQNGFGGFEYDPGDYLALCTKNLGSDGG